MLVQIDNKTIKYLFFGKKEKNGKIVDMQEGVRKEVQIVYIINFSLN